jgi:hypothetical protein
MQVYTFWWMILNTLIKCISALRIKARTRWSGVPIIIEKLMSSVCLHTENCFKWTTGLTGTPVGNGYGNLHGQYLVLDKGVRLGRHKVQFDTNFMTRGRFNQHTLMPGSKERIVIMLSSTSSFES